MSGADWVIIAAYLAAMLALSFRLGRGQTGLDDYYLGGRRLPWWSVGLSVWLGLPALHWMWWNAIGFGATWSVALALLRGAPPARACATAARAPSDSMRTIALPLLVWWLLVLAAVTAIHRTAA